MSTLKVYFRDSPCARLTETASGRLRLQYLDAWMAENGAAVSTRLPVTRESYEDEHVAPFVASFLPEGETLRRRLEKLLHVDAAHDFGLHAVIGRESAGALSFWPEDEELPAGGPRYIPLGDAEFDHWTEHAHELPLQFPRRAIRLSLAGVQSKTALYFDDKDKAYLPENGAPTTHILKPRIPGCRPSSVFVELITIRLAQSVLGQDRVPAADLWRNCYRVRRFDRPWLATGVNWLHQVIVNVLLHNPNAHLKNYAFLYQEDGALEIAPLYDCLCTYNLRFEPAGAAAWDQGTGPAVHARDLSLQIGQAERIDEIGMTDWESFAEECGFTRAFVRRRLRLRAENVREQLRPAIDTVL